MTATARCQGGPLAGQTFELKVVCKRLRFVGDKDYAGKYVARFHEGNTTGEEIITYVWEEGAK